MVENPKKKKLNFIKTLLFFMKQGVEALNELQNSQNLNNQKAKV